MLRRKGAECDIAKRASRGHVVLRMENKTTRVEEGGGTNPRRTNVPTSSYLFPEQIPNRYQYVEEGTDKNTNTQKQASVGRGSLGGLNPSTMSQDSCFSGVRSTPTSKRVLGGERRNTQPKRNGKVLPTGLAAPGTPSQVDPTARRGCCSLADSPWRTLLEMARVGIRVVAKHAFRKIDVERQPA